MGSAGTEWRALKVKQQKTRRRLIQVTANVAVTCCTCKFLPRSGGMSCIECPRGEFQADPGAESCDLCPNGRYQNELGQTFCSDCGPGRFGNGTGGATTAASCLACPAGMFQDGVAQQSCRPCAAGTYQSAREQSSCTPCRSGSWSAAVLPRNDAQLQIRPESACEGTLAHCAECSAGQYQKKFIDILHAVQSRKARCFRSRQDERSRAMRRKRLIS